MNEFKKSLWIFPKRRTAHGRAAFLREECKKHPSCGNTERKFVDPSRSRSLASFRPDRVTYWVEYNRVGADYHIHTVYSHRMEMKRKGTP